MQLNVEDEDVGREAMKSKKEKKKQQHIDK